LKKAKRHFKALNQNPTFFHFCIIMDFGHFGGMGALTSKFYERYLTSCGTSPLPFGSAGFLIEAKFEIRKMTEIALATLLIFNFTIIPFCFWLKFK